MKFGRGICTVCERFFEKRELLQTKCTDCLEKDESDYGKVRGYLERHEGATVSDVMMDTGVALRTIDRFVAERRVYIINNRLKSDGV